MRVPHQGEARQLLERIFRRKLYLPFRMETRVATPAKRKEAAAATGASEAGDSHASRRKLEDGSVAVSARVVSQRVSMLIVIRPLSHAAAE